MPSTAHRPPLRDLAKAVWSLVAPLPYKLAQPTASGLAYAGPRWGRAARLDVYTPDEAHASRASVILVHGGGFVIGSRRMKPVRFLATRLLERGLTVAAVDYRLLFRGGRLETALDDVSQATDYWKRRAGDFGADPGRIAILGISAGSLLALSALAKDQGAPEGVSQENRAAYPLTAGISIFGFHDMSGLGGALATQLPRLMTGSKDPGVWRRASPLHQPLDRRPLLLIHGREDSIVPVSQALALAERRERAGLPTQTLFFDGAPHSFLNWPGEWAERAAAAAADFALAAGSSGLRCAASGGVAIPPESLGLAATAIQGSAP